MTNCPSHSDKVRVQLWELGGKAKTAFTVCLVDGQGHHTQVAHEVLNENSGEQKSERQVIDKTISNALGKYLVCIIDGKVVIGNFKYAPKASEA